MPTWQFNRSDRRRGVPRGPGRGKVRGTFRPKTAQDPRPGHPSFEEVTSGTEEHGEGGAHGARDGPFSYYVKL